MVRCTRRLGLGDPALRAPGPGIPYPDPEYPPPAIEAINGSLAQQTGYCAGVPSFQSLVYRRVLLYCIMNMSGSS